MKNIFVLTLLGLLIALATPQESEFENQYQRVDEENLGEGAQGSVFKVTKKGDPTGKIYAAKTYLTAEIYQGQVPYENEIILYQLLPKDEPMIGNMIEHFDEGDKKILVLDFIDGQLYKKHHDTLPAVCNYIAVALVCNYTTEIAFKYALQMTRMLQVMEQNNIMYGDFHGENIMLKSDGNLILTDFGYSTLLTEDENGDIQTTGTSRCFSRQYLDLYGGKNLTTADQRKAIFKHHTNELTRHFSLILNCTVEENESLSKLAQLRDEIKMDHGRIPLQLCNYTANQEWIDYMKGNQTETGNSQTKTSEVAEVHIEDSITINEVMMKLQEIVKDDFKLYNQIKETVQEMKMEWGYSKRMNMSGQSKNLVNLIQ